jgi:hypothetical protein
MLSSIPWLLNNLNIYNPVFSLTNNKRNQTQELMNKTERLFGLKIEANLYLIKI